MISKRIVTFGAALFSMVLINSCLKDDDETISLESPQTEDVYFVSNINTTYVWSRNPQKKYYHDYVLIYDDKGRISQFTCDLSTHTYSYGDNSIVALIFSKADLPCTATLNKQGYISNLTIKTGKTSLSYENGFLKRANIDWGYFNNTWNVSFTNEDMTYINCKSESHITYSNELNDANIDLNSLIYYTESIEVAIFTEGIRSNLPIFEPFDLYGKRSKHIINTINGGPMYGEHNNTLSVNVKVQRDVNKRISNIKYKVINPISSSGETIDYTLDISYRHGRKVTKDGVTTYTWDK